MRIAVDEIVAPYEKPPEDRPAPDGWMWLGPWRWYATRSLWARPRKVCA